MLRFLLTAALLLSCALPIMAQACFNVVPRKGCAPLTVRVESCAPDTLTQVYDFDQDGNVDKPDTTWTYTTPGTKIAVQYVVSSSDTVFIEVLPAVSPAFELRSCANDQVFLQITEQGSYDVFIINYGDGTQEDTIDGTTDIIHQYATPGSYNIEVQGNFIDADGNFGSINCGSSQQTFQTRKTLPLAEIKSLEIINNNTLELRSSLASGIIYVLEEKIGANDYQLKRKLSLTDTLLTITNIDAFNEIYCYRIGTVDSCTSLINYSEEICTLPLSTSTVPDQINLNWRAYQGAGFQRYELSKDNTLIFETSSAALASYQDLEINCLEQYCYQIQAVMFSRALSISNIVCSSTTSNQIPPSVSLVRASTDERDIIISWQNPSNLDINDIEINYQLNGNLITESIGVVEHYTITDVNTDQEVYCAEVILSDVCDNQSEVAGPTCQVVLSGEKSMRNNLLTWTSFEGLSGNFNYTLEILASDGTVLESISNINASRTSYLDTEVESRINYYRLKVVSQDQSDIVAYSNVVVIEDGLDLKIPNAFSPNADGLNDRFNLVTSTVATLNFKIFNRWGTVVYHTDRLGQGWDGLYKGEEAPSGTYTYIVEGVDIFGDRFVRRGKFQLIR